MNLTRYIHGVLWYIRVKLLISPVTWLFFLKIIHRVYLNMFKYTRWIIQSHCISTRNIRNTLAAGFIASDSKFHGANMESTWILSDPDGPHVDPMNLAIRLTDLTNRNESNKGPTCGDWVGVSIPFWQVLPVGRHLDGLHRKLYVGHTSRSEQNYCHFAAILQTILLNTIFFKHILCMQHYQKLRLKVKWRISRQYLTNKGRFYQAHMSSPGDIELTAAGHLTQNVKSIIYSDCKWVLIDWSISD